MTKQKTWNLVGVEVETQKKAEEHAKVIGSDVGTWVNKIIMDALESKISKGQLREFIRDSQGQLESYHAHKERMAWQAVALFQVTAIAIGGFGFEKSFAISTDIFISILLVIAYLLALGFVRMQLKAKNKASDRIGACMRLLFVLNSVDISESDLSFPENEAWPNILKNETKRYGEKRRSNRNGINDSIKHLWNSTQSERCSNNLHCAWGKLVDHEKQELIITAVMTLTAIVTLLGVVLPPVNGS